jgi:hypothetical protein
MSRSTLVGLGSTLAFPGLAYDFPGWYICFPGRNSRLWARKRLIRPPLAGIVVSGPISAFLGRLWLLWAPARPVHRHAWVAPACPPRPTVGPRLGLGPCSIPTSAPASLGSVLGCARRRGSRPRPLSAGPCRVGPPPALPGQPLPGRHGRSQPRLGPGLRCGHCCLSGRCLQARNSSA